MLSFREKVQRFITYSKVKKNPVLLLIVTVLCFAIVIVTGKVYDPPYIDPAAVKLNTPENTAVQMTFVGDVMMGRDVKLRAELEGYDQVFTGVSALWKDSDIVMGNLEHPILQKPESAYKKSEGDILLSGEPEAVKALKDAGFNLVGLANNHFRNYGKDGMRSTFRVLNEYGLAYTGAGNNKEEASTYYVQEINGFKVAIIAATDFIANRGGATENSPGSLSNRHRDFYTIVNAAATETDFTVVYIHFGTENTLVPTDEATEIAHQIIDAGADVVIGAHPHVVLPIEQYRGGIICYSTGNFVFDQSFERQTESTMVNYTITEDGKGQIEFIPIKIVDGFPRVALQSGTINRINHYLTKDLSDNAYTVTDDGHILISAPGINLADVERRLQQEAAANQLAGGVIEQSTANEAEATVTP